MSIANSKSWLQLDSPAITEPSWLQGFREQQEILLAQSHLPTKLDEHWKYTDLTFISQKKFKLFSKTTSENYNHKKINYLIAEKKLENFHTIVCLNGEFCAELSSQEPLDNGIYIGNLNSAPAAYQPFILQQLNAQEIKKSLFVYLNASKFVNGLLIWIPENCSPPPFQIVNIISNDEQDGNYADALMLNNPMLFVVLNKNSQLNFLQEYISLGSKNYFTNAVNYIYLHDNASLTHYKIQAEDKYSTHISNSFYFLNANTEVNLLNFSNGASFARDAVQAYLQRPQAAFSAKGFYKLVHNEQQTDQYLDIHHLAEMTESEMLYKGLIDKKSRAVFNGRVYVAPNANKINAYQGNYNLLLSPQAEAYSKPELEIYAQDVKCKHGSSVGQIDLDAMFYLRSRGLTESEAKSMLIQGFADEILQAIPCQSIQHKVEEFL